MRNAKLFVFFLLIAITVQAASHRPAHRRQQSAKSTKPHATKSRKQLPLKKATARHRAAKATTHAQAVASIAKRRSAKRRPAVAVATTAHRRAARGRTLAVAHRPVQPPTNRAYTVTATVYQAVAGQTDASPFITADNSRIRPRYGSHTRWLALSPDLLKQGGGKFHYGDKVQVSRVSPQLDGVYTVHDTMNRRHRHRIDILTHRREKLSVFAPGAKLRLAPAPRKSRAQATAVAHARPGRKVAKPVAGHAVRRASRQRAG